jgi:hypothetical protein
MQLAEQASDGITVVSSPRTGHTERAIPPADPDDQESCQSKDCEIDSRRRDALSQTEKIEAQ